VNVFRQRINALFTGGVAELRAAGAELLPEDYAWLWDLSKAAVEVGRDIPETLSLPVMVGPVALHPYTVGSWLWWKMARDWFDEGDETVLAMAWMLNKAPDQKAFLAASTRRRARFAVLCWAASLPWRTTIEQLAAGVSAAVGAGDGEMVPLEAPGEVKADPASVPDYGRFIIQLCARRNLKPDDVKWNLPAAEVYAMAAADKDGNVPEESGQREFMAYRAAIAHLKQARAKPPQPPEPPAEAAP
jgi:hypothetical protein